MKLFDGSLVSAGDLVSGAGQDEEGNHLTFSQVGSTWIAESNVPGDKTKKRVYSFALADTQVKVSMVILDRRDATSDKPDSKPQEREESKQSQQREKAQASKSEPTTTMKTEKAYKSVGFRQSSP